MKTILKITKNELSTLFYSPIAWLILIIFTFQSGMSYAHAWSEALRSLALGYNLYGMTERLLLGWQFPACKATSICTFRYSQWD